MNTNFTIKNFRVFDENGVDVYLAPITILTGKNSAGKSSIVKAIAILNSFIEEIWRDKENGKTIELYKYKIQFSELFEGTLGDFRSVLHRGAENHCITFEYIIHSTMLFDDVKVSFSFKDADDGKDNTHLHYGILSMFCVKTLQDDIIYFSDENGEFCCNLNLVKKSFLEFAQSEYIAHVYMGVLSNETGTIEEKRKNANHIKEYLEKFNEETRKNVYRYLRNIHSSKTPVIEDYSLFEMFESYENNDKQIFSIPVISEYLAGFEKDDLVIKVDEILGDDKSLDDAEKDVIKHLVTNIVACGKKIDAFWLEQETEFLDSVGKDKTRTEEQKNIAIFKKLANKGVRLPNPYLLEVGDEFWERNPGRWTTKNENKENKAKEIIRWKETPLDTFPIMYEVLMRLNAAYEKWGKKTKTDSSPSKIYSYEENIEYPAGRYTHYMYKLLCEYTSRAIENLLFPEWTNNFKYIPSSRALPKRLYTPETDRVFYTTLKEYLIAKTEYEGYQKRAHGSNKKNYIADSFLNKWIGKEGFNICKSISIESVVGTAIIVRLTKEDGSEVFLTDEGFGLTQLVSMLIIIETAILNARGVSYNNYWHQSDLDGLNTTQFYYELQTIAVEEPELHLHPSFQSKLADMFKSASEYNIHFIVETHSEYLVRRAQRLVAEKKYQNEKQLKSNNPFKVVYCPQNDRPYDMELNIYGRFTNFFDEGFFDVASNDALAISKIERTRR